MNIPGIHQFVVKGFSPEGREFFVGRSLFGKPVILRDQPHPLFRKEAETLLVEATRAAPCATYELVRVARCSSPPRLA